MQATCSCSSLGLRDWIIIAYAVCNNYSKTFSQKILTGQTVSKVTRPQLWLVQSRVAIMIIEAYALNSSVFILSSKYRPHAGHKMSDVHVFAPPCRCCTCCVRIYLVLSVRLESERERECRVVICTRVRWSVRCC